MIIEWIQSNSDMLGWLAVISLVSVVLTAAVVPWLVIQIPADYFSNNHRKDIAWSQKHPLLRALIITLKNSIGLVFLLVGLVLLILPGQGILTILIGLMLMDFPGKFNLERTIVKKRAVLKSINWLRRKAKRPDIFID